MILIVRIIIVSKINCSFFFLHLFKDGYGAGNMQGIFHSPEPDFPPLSPSLPLNPHSGIYFHHPYTCRELCRRESLRLDKIY